MNRRTSPTTVYRIQPSATTDITNASTTCSFITSDLAQFKGNDSLQGPLAQESTWFPSFGQGLPELTTAYVPPSTNHDTTIQSPTLESRLPDGIKFSADQVVADSIPVIAEAADSSSTQDGSQAVNPNQDNQSLQVLHEPLKVKENEFRSTRSKVFYWFTAYFGISEFLNFRVVFFGFLLARWSGSELWRLGLRLLEAFLVLFPIG
ncbi:hypothetical protein L2E82_38996 [Cichorium intybus]|uniref:Uncharacterized protein n=1 Tax=Cichorium intybus TaxID=13427 RepID=A0ACB9AGA1_CICIN|nr:hypothetical protein L2E82_38996 [Cichorium intybus]